MIDQSNAKQSVNDPNKKTQIPYIQMIVKNAVCTCNATLCYVMLMQRSLFTRLEIMKVNPPLT